MNTTSEDNQQNDGRETRAKSTAVDSFEQEPAPSHESADSRETVEGGYGWGV